MRRTTCITGFEPIEIMSQDSLMRLVFQCPVNLVRAVVGGEGFVKLVL